MQTIGDPVVRESDRSVRDVVAQHAREAPVVLITGCSAGIGRAAAVALVAAGYRVVATARQPETLAGCSPDVPAGRDGRSIDSDRRRSPARTSRRIAVRDQWLVPWRITSRQHVHEYRDRYGAHAEHRHERNHNRNRPRRVLRAGPKSHERQHARPEAVRKRCAATATASRTEVLLRPAGGFGAPTRGGFPPATATPPERSSPRRRATTPPAPSYRGRSSRPRSSASQR
jgi:hypothetical protein